MNALPAQARGCPLFFPACGKPVCIMPFAIPVAVRVRNQDIAVLLWQIPQRIEVAGEPVEQHDVVVHGEVPALNVFFCKNT